MTYKNKTYIAFDGDNDIKYYFLLKAWKKSKNIDFDFYDAHDLNNSKDSSLTDSIKEQLRKRMENSKIFVLLLGEHTRYLTKFVKWEVEHAKKLELPIIVVNLNKNRHVDTKLMPKWLHNYPSISCSFEYPIIKYSLENWGKCHKNHYKNHENNSYEWKECVYDNL